MENKQKDYILFHFGLFVGVTAQEKSWNVTDILDIVKECCDENSK